MFSESLGVLRWIRDEARRPAEPHPLNGAERSPVDANIFQTYALAMTRGPYPAEAVANYFLEKSWEEGKSVDPLKIQKLVYFANGWHLGLYGSPLIDEEVRAWTYGPVIT